MGFVCLFLGHIQQHSKRPNRIQELKLWQSKRMANSLPALQLLQSQIMFYTCQMWIRILKILDFRLVNSFFPSSRSYALKIARLHAFYNHLLVLQLLTRGNSQNFFPFWGRCVATVGGAWEPWSQCQDLCPAEKHVFWFFGLFPLILTPSNYFCILFHNPLFHPSGGPTHVLSQTLENLIQN